MEKPPLTGLYRSLFWWSLPFILLYFGLPVLSKELGASAAAIGGLFSVFTATTLVLRPLVGRALDHFGRKPFFLLSLVVYAGAMAAFAWADTLGGLYLARIIQGAGSALLWSSVNTIVSDLTTPSERGRAMGRVDQVTSQGGMVGVLIGFSLMMLLSEGRGWQAAFLLFSLLTLFGAWTAWRQVPETRAAASAAHPPTPRNRMLVILLVAVFVTGVSEALLAPIYLTYLQDKHTTDIFSLAWAFFPAGLVMAFLSTRLGALSDRFGRVPMLVLGLAGSGLISFVLPNLPSLLWLGAGYTLNAVLWSISEPAETALIADLTGAARYGTAFGLYDFITSLGFTLGPLLGGLVYDLFNPAIPFYLNGTILLLSAGWVLLLLRTPAVQTG